MEEEKFFVVKPIEDLEEEQKKKLKPYKKLENSFAVTFESLAEKLAELDLRKSGEMRAEGDTDADLQAQIAAIKVLQEAEKSRMAEQLEKEQGARGREKPEDFVQIDMAQGEEDAKKLAGNLKSAGIDCSVVKKDGAFVVKIELSNEIVKGNSDVVANARPGSSPSGAKLGEKQILTPQENGRGL